MDNLLKPASEFNSAIKFLSRVYVAKKKGTFEEEKAMRTNKRLNFVIDSEPVWMIEICGPFFLKYANIIKHRDWDALLNYDFSEEKNSYKKTDDGSRHSFDAMDGKIKFIKKLFLSSTEEEREEMGNAVSTLLSSYCKFALEVKKSKKSKNT